MAHTPGPWQVAVTDDHRVLSGRQTIAMCDGDYGRTSYETGAANARLIAAAPDLLATTELLESLCTWLLHRFGPDSLEGHEASFRLSHARTAIAAATTDQEK